MVDIHSHIVYGVDDGAATLAESLQMLEVAAASGTTDIVATPHSNAEFPYQDEVIEERIEELRAHAGDTIRIHKGCELRLSYENIQTALADPSRYSINGNGYLLIEFADSAVPPNSGAIFEQMLNRGLTSIITHPERNNLLQRRIADLGRWVEQGCLIQITAQSLLGGFGPAAKRTCEELLARGLVHFVASDAHDPEYRTPRLEAAFDWVAGKFGFSTAEALFRQNPACALTGESLGSTAMLRPVAERSWLRFFR